ncbi:MAG: polysaccharide deacetylase family protein [Bacillota bacterium]|nr:polysaccharide deacetylase family protein [Bacillota bacterium]
MINYIAKKVYTTSKSFKNRIYNHFDTPVLVLAYHRVANLENDIFKNAVTPQTFFNQMKYLRDNYNILRFEDDWANKEKKSIVITFDDGYEDNYTEMLPIIEKLQIPVVVFVSTANIETESDNWDYELENIVMHGNLPINIHIHSNIINKKWEINTSIDRNNFFKEIHSILVEKGNYEYKNIIFEQIKSQVQYINPGKNINKIMNKQQLKKLSMSKYITVGTHSVNHLSLPTLTYEQQYKEITDSKNYIQKIIDKDVNLISYPFNMYNDDTLDIVKKCNFKKGAAGLPGAWHENRNNSFTIPRNSVVNEDMDKFIKRIHNYWTK